MNEYKGQNSEGTAAAEEKKWKGMSMKKQVEKNTVKEQVEKNV